MDLDETRKHGLQRPFNFYQILSWIIFTFELLTAYLVFLPPLSHTLKVYF